MTSTINSNHPMKKKKEITICIHSMQTMCACRHPLTRAVWSIRFHWHADAAPKCYSVLFRCLPRKSVNQKSLSSRMKLFCSLFTFFLVFALLLYAAVHFIFRLCVERAMWANKNQSQKRLFEFNETKWIFHNRSFALERIAGIAAMTT